MRAYMDEGGRVLYTGKQAGQQYTGAGVGTQFYDPKGEAACRPVDPAMDPRRCLVLRGSTQGGDLINDVLQYWFGGMVQIAGDGQDGTTPFPINGIGNPFDGLAQWSLTAPTAANTTSSFVTTSGVLPVDEYPQFESSASSRWAKPGGPFDPHTGSKYVYSQIADVIVQAAHARDRGAGGRRRPDVLDVLRHRAGLGLPRGRSEDGGRQRLDDAAGRQRPHDPEHGPELPGRARRAGRTSCTRT